MHFLSSLTPGRFVGYWGRILLSLTIAGMCFVPEARGQAESDEKNKEKGFTLIKRGLDRLLR